MTTDVAMRVSLDYDPSGRISTGLRVIAEAAIRRLDQRAGTLFYSEDDYGESVVDMIGRNLTGRQIEALISRQLRKDERISRVSVETTQLDADTFQYVVECETEDGDFALTFDASSLGINLAEISGVNA